MIELAAFVVILALLPAALRVLFALLFFGAIIAFFSYGAWLLVQTAVMLAR